MQETRSRARDLSPSLVVTLLSIVQAIALETLVSSVRETSFLWMGDLRAAVGWMQVAIAFQGIIVLWVAYVGLVVRFVWIPRIRDMVIPFVLGIFQFVLASALEPEWLVWWLLLLALLMVIGTITNSSIFLAASKLEENREHFAVLSKLSPGIYGFWSLYSPLMIFVALILSSALLVSIYGATTRIALVALFLTNLVLVVQFMQIRFYWNRALFGPGEE